MDTYGEGGFGLLGDPTRRAIFELLARRPSSVGELARQLPVSRPAVSQHLRVLKDGGLVVSRAEGTRRVYQLNPNGVSALRAYLDRVWDEALTTQVPGAAGRRRRHPRHDPERRRLDRHPGAVRQGGPVIPGENREHRPVDLGRSRSSRGRT